MNGKFIEEAGERVYGGGTIGVGKVTQRLEGTDRSRWGRYK